MPSFAGYGWNAVTHRYYDLDTGKFVSKATIRNALESVMDVSAVRMNKLSEKLAQGVISLADWEKGMLGLIKQSNIAAAALANGGWHNMSQSDWGAVGNFIRGQYDYLRNFAKEIAEGKQALDGRFLVRTDMYGDAANTMYAHMRTRGFIADGYDEERRVLEDKVNACDDCIDYAAEGWQPIGTLPEPGDESVCLTRCRCEKEFRISTEAGSETE